jgi:hypothetical protein
VAVDLFGKGSEGNATVAEVVQHGYQVAQAAAQAVELPDRQRVAAF